MAKNRLFVKIKRDLLPKVRDRYPYLYLEYGRLEVDDSSVQWIDSEGDVMRLPIATILCLMLGPGTSVTHEAMKVLADSHCTVCWVGEDCLLFYAYGQAPTATTKLFNKQLKLVSDPKKALTVARAMFNFRFPDEDVKNKNLKELMGMEGIRVKRLYQEKAKHYNVGWRGRQYTPGDFQLSDITNQVLTACNAALYGLISATVHSLGYSPYMGFVHTGSPLPFVYDLADLYKADVCIDLAFALTLELAGDYDKYVVAQAFRSRVLDTDLLARLPQDIEQVLSRGG